MSMINNKIKEEATLFKEGDAFVGIAKHPLVFMEINEVQESTDCMDFCVISWYNLNEKGLHTQKRFPMSARDGKFSDFEPISRNLLKEAKSLMRQYDTAVKQSTEEKEAKSLFSEYTRKLIELLPCIEERLAFALQSEKEIVTNTWLNCEEEPEKNDKYVTLVCVSSESYYDKENKTITEQFIYLRDNCPYSWGTLAKRGAKYMVIEKPPKVI